MTEFLNFGFVSGEVADVELSDLGDRNNARCTVNVSSGDSFITVQLNSPRNADRNYAEQLFDELQRGDFIQVNGILEEYEYDGEYRRNIRPFVSNKNGYSNSINIYADDRDREEKATARIAGDVTEIEEYYEDEEQHMMYEVLVFDTYNPEGDEELTRRQVVKGEIENYINYIQNRDDTTEQDVKLAKEHLQSLKNTDGDDVKGIVNVIKEFDDDFNPRMFNLNFYHLTATGEVIEEMEEVEEYDNVALGVYIRNEVQVDDFGYSDGTTNLLEIGKLKEHEKNQEVDDLDW